MLKTELKHAFTFYTNINKQYRYRPHNLSEEPFMLLCGTQSFLPFQIRFPHISNTGSVSKVELYSIDNNLITTYTPLPDTFYAYTGVWMYVSYLGGNLGSPIAPGCYYLIVYDQDSIPMYSETFKAVEASVFNKLLRLDWQDSNDIDPLFYQNGFHNKIYLDTYTEAMPPKLEEDGDENEFGDFIPTYQRVSHKHRLLFPAPDYLLDALSLLPLHTDVQVTENGENAQLERVKVSTDYDENYAGLATIEFETTEYKKSNCSNNIPLI